MKPLQQIVDAPQSAFNNPNKLDNFYKTKLRFKIIMGECTL